MNTEKKQKLNDLVVTIELTLMSVIQGVALFFLADNARAAILSSDYEHWVYIITGFIFLVTFWSQALVHIISFITWPIELVHNFLYFLVVIAEVLMFTNIGNPVSWFAANAAFFFVVGILYAVDFSLMKHKAGEFENSPERKQFFQDILGDQKFGMNALVPAGLAFSLISLFLVEAYPQMFIAGGWHLALGGIQAAAGIAMLCYLVSIFKKRFITIAEI